MSSKPLGTFALNDALELFTFPSYEYQWLFATGLVSRCGTVLSTAAESAAELVVNVLVVRCAFSKAPFGRGCAWPLV